MMTLWSEAVLGTRREAESRLAEREQTLAAREAQLQRHREDVDSATALANEQRARATVDLTHAVTALEQERRHASALQESLSEAVQSLRDAQATIEALRRGNEEAQRRHQTDLARTSAGEQRWLKEVDRAREETKTAVHAAKLVGVELARERQQRLKHEAQHSAATRVWKQKTAALEKALKTVAAKRPAALPRTVQLASADRRHRKAVR